MVTVMVTFEFNDESLYTLQKTIVIGHTYCVSISKDSLQNVINISISTAYIHN